MLLDDIFDKLDRGRVEQLMSLLINGDFGQVFITDTHEKRMEEIIEGFGTDFKKFVINFGTAKVNESTSLTFISDENASTYFSIITNMKRHNGPASQRRSQGND